MPSTEKFDVAIIGGGPAGSTVGTLLKKYRPQLRVVILERESFPRDHIGESQLPFIGFVLDEMGCWDKVEAAGFPIKIGATYRWGQSDKLWDFEFLSNGNFEPKPRPSVYQSQRRETAFQVDRAVYDKILLDHARECGCDVREQTCVVQVSRDDDEVSGLHLEGPEGAYDISARYYVDCSGYVSVLRKAFGVETEVPTGLQNIAIWDYWRGGEWAVNVGIEGTRVQVLSVGYGWIWYIPLGHDRTSVGLIVPAKYYKEQGRPKEDLYSEALKNDPIVAKLLAKATPEGKLQATSDWSFMAGRMHGGNWFLAGEAAGFADPILAAGMTLAHKGARDVAYTINEIEHGEIGGKWLKEQYTEATRRQITQHIRFADFWYSNNGQFSDLKDFAKEISGDAGLAMTSDEAWRWLGTGGFIDDTNSSTDIAGFSLYISKNIASSFLKQETTYSIFGKTHYVLDIGGATQTSSASYSNGRVQKHYSYERDGKKLPMLGVCGFLAHGLVHERSAVDIMRTCEKYGKESGMSKEDALRLPRLVIETLEAMMMDGWVKARTVPGHKPWPKFETDYTRVMHQNQDVSKLLEPPSESGAG